MTDSVNSRELVLAILLAVTKDGIYSHVAISDVLTKYQYLEKQERSFITRVSEGTLERMLELDYIINQFSSVKVNKMKPVIRCIIRSAVYEMKYMDSVPVSASCNEAVKLAKKKGFGKLSGFVNGVQRNIGRNLDKITYPDKEKAYKQYLSVTYSIPEWMITLWEKNYSLERIEKIAEAFLKEEPLTIRCNLTKITPEALAERLKNHGMEVNIDEKLPYALHVSGVDYLGSIPEFAEGLFYVQDLSSMKVAEAAEVKENDTVIAIEHSNEGRYIFIYVLLI